MRVRRGQLPRIHWSVYAVGLPVLSVRGTLTARVLRSTWRQLAEHPRQTLARITAASGIES